MSHVFEQQVLYTSESDPYNPPLPPNRGSRLGRSQILRVLLTGFGVVSAVCLLVAGLLVQILVVHRFHFTSHSLLTAAPLGATLAIAHACSTVVTTTVPLVIGLEAFRLSSTWLAASQVDGENRPTPFQLGMLMTVFNGANTPALWAGATYLLGIRSSGTMKFIKKPGILRHAVLMLFVFLGMGYTCAAFEAWLGVTSESTPFPQLTNFNGPVPLVSRQVNETLCDIFKAGTPSVLEDLSDLCGILTGGSGGNQGFPEGIRTLTNTSATNAVVFSDDRTAIVVPPASNIPENIGFVAQSYGVQATCKSITSLCVNLSSGADLGPEAFLNITCPPSVLFNASLNTNTGPGYKDGYPFGVLDSTGNILYPSTDVNASHFVFGAVVSSFAYTGLNIDTVNSSGPFIGSTGFFPHGNNGAYNVLSCDVQVYSVKYQYANGSFTTINKSAADIIMARRVAATVGYATMDIRVPDAVEGSGLLSGDYAQSFALELSRELIALTGFIYEAQGPLEIHAIQPIIGSRLQLVPLIFLLVILTAYCLAVLVVMALALIGTNSKPHTTLARNWLINPLLVFNAAFGPVDAQRTWDESTKELFRSETDNDRLNIGPFLTEKGTELFGVSRGPIAR